jgi:hypothetical protein
MAGNDLGQAFQVWTFRREEPSGSGASANAMVAFPDMTWFKR